MTNWLLKENLFLGSVICPKILSDWHGHKVRAHLLHAMGNWAKEGGTAQHRKGGSRILDEKVWFLDQLSFIVSDT